MAEIRLCGLQPYPMKKNLCGKDPFHAIEKERFNKMSAPKPSTATVIGMQARVLARKTWAKIPQSLWKQIFRPCALGFIGLAIAVALWGFSYKLSLYRQHSGASSPISVAKLWIESRNASVVAGSGVTVQSHLLRISQVLPAAAQRFPRSACGVDCILPECRHTVAYFDFLIPFRSPPALRLSTA